LFAWWGEEFKCRQERPWIARVAIPLEAVAVALAGLWFYELVVIVPLLWFSLWEASWIWILGVEEAAFGIQWAYTGVYSLMAWSNKLVVVGALWVCYAGVVALVGVISRWRYKWQYGW
jgi:hypothetical protein